jgi:DNA-binding NtrC family response regulator
VRALRDYDWPGNVRELEHAIEHAMVLAQKDVIGAGDLPFARQMAPPRESGQMASVGAIAPPAPPDVERISNGVGDAPHGVFTGLDDLPYAEAKRRLLATFDERYTSELLRRTGGNMSEAARRAGLDRSNFRRLLRRHKEDEG